MATTKTSGTLVSAQNLAAAGADFTSSALSMTTDYGASLLVKLTNGATGPTVAARFQVEVSHDNSLYAVLYGPISGDVTANGQYKYPVTIPKWYKYARVVAGGNTGQAVTLDVTYAQITAQ